MGGLTGTSSSRPGTSGGNSSVSDLLDQQSLSRQDMLQMGYLPAEEFSGITSLNQELKEQNKRLRAELVAAKVEHQKLRMEEAFLRERAIKADLEPPNEVVAAPLRPVTSRSNSGP